MKPGYVTNGIGDVDPLEALPLLSELGYRSVAVTLDHHTLHPGQSDLAMRLARWREELGRHGMDCVVETGARHLLDPRVKHEPTFVTADPDARRRRVDFLRAAIDLAAELGAGCVSLWSGAARDAADEATIFSRLTAGLEPVIHHAVRRGVRLGFEPEPGMVIDTLDRYEELAGRLGHPDVLGLTVDVGHLECMGEWPAADRLRPWAARVVNVHVDDMLACRHEHLPLGTGDVDLAAVLAPLAAAGYRGGLHVELPRQSHRWIETAARSIRVLAPILSPESFP